MVTVNNKVGDGKTATFEFAGLSSDTKPTGKIGGTVIKKGDATVTIGAQEIGENSLFLELDTGDLYYYSAAAWSKVGGENESV